MRLAIWCLACVVAGHVILHSVHFDARPRGPSSDGTATLIARFLSGTDVPLTSYRAFRTLEATARGGGIHARLTAWTTVDPVEGFQYSIVQEDGSGLIRRNVLRAALEAERSLREGGEISRSALTEANYEFMAAGRAEDGLVRIGINPRRRDTLLVEGSLLLTEEAGELVRVEGLLTKRPSVWTRRVEVVRRYDRVAGVRVPVSLQSTARVLLVGASTFSMTYEYESVNGQLVKSW